MARRKIVDIERIENLTPVHIALDFYNGNAIVSTKEQVITTYEDDKGEQDEKMEQRNYCVLSTGKAFWNFPKNLREHGLFYNGSPDLPDGRWLPKDINHFCNGNQTAPRVE